MQLYLYNTLTRKKEVFKPIKKTRVGMYTCGPTVYWYATIGNFRTYIFSDILRRTLEYNKLKVLQVMNVTDVGHLVGDGDAGLDKIEEAALKEKKSAQEIAAYYLQVFLNDMQKLHILMPEEMPKATEHIDEQIELIKKLEKKGFTYKTSDGIYFDSAKFGDYGKLARLNIEGLEAGKRISLGEKHAKTDFALWKFSEDPGKRQQEWGSPWGVGYPGWHIECSAMSMKYLGQHFDIHTGGEDHIPVHHTNEIAQSECATGKPFVNYWLHGAFLTFKGEKVSKSKGGLYTVSELQELGYKPEHYRYLCLLTHYRKPLDFSLEHLDAARAAYERITRKISELRKTPVKGKDTTKSHVSAFLEAINDDLNMPEAIQVFIKTLDDSMLDGKKKLALLEKFDEVLGLNVEGMKESHESVPEEVSELVNEREAARKAKEWKKADVARDKLKKLGYEVEDTPQGSIVRKI